MSDSPGPYVEEHGRIHRIVLDVYIPEDVTATRDELLSWLEWELGVSGQISQHNPYYEHGHELCGKEIVEIEDMKRRSFTEWEAARPDGSRSGRRKVEFL